MSSSCVNSKRQGLEIESIECLSLSLLKQCPVVFGENWAMMDGWNWIRGNVNSEIFRFPDIVDSHVSSSLPTSYFTERKKKKEMNE